MANFNNVNDVEVIKPRGSYQDLSHNVKLTTEVGRLVPTCCFPLMPGERVRLKSDFFARLMPMYAPLMDNFDILSWWFASPLRLDYSDLPNFLTGGTDNDLSDTLYQLPRLKINLNTKTYTNRAGETIAFDYTKVWGSKSLADYLNLSPWINIPDQGMSADDLRDLDHDDNISAIPFRIYHRIWNDYFRNQNLEPEEWDYTDGGTHDASPIYLKLRYKNFNKDYFTSSLPDTILGQEQPIPLDVDIVYDENMPYDIVHINDTRGASQIPQAGPSAATPGTLSISGNIEGSSFPLDPSNPDNNISGLVTRQNASGSLGLATTLDNSANLRGINASLTINNLRAAIAVQEFQELNARAGHRYIEFIMANFGVKSSDARLQRPEFLGGCRVPVNISAVLQNSAPSSQADSGVLGSMGGYGQAVGDVPGVEFYAASEITYIMNIICVVPHNTYMQGIPAYLSQENRFDFPIPLLAGLGDQPIKNREVFFDIYNHNQDAKEYNDKTFGYTARYNQYRFLPDSIHGDFRETLNTWHLARLFNPLDRPELNAEFIKINPEDYNRIFNVTSSDFDHFLINIYHTIDSFRCIPRIGVPKLSSNPANKIV